MVADTASQSSSSTTSRPPRTNPMGRIDTSATEHPVRRVDQPLTPLVEQDARPHLVHRVAERETERRVGEPDAAARADVTEGVLAEHDGVLLRLGAVVHGDHEPEREPSG